MVKNISSIQVRWEKQSEAVQWAQQIEAYVNTHFPDHRFKMFWRRFYPGMVLYWMTEAEDLASLESYLAQMEADTGFQELRRRALHCFLFDTFDVVLLSSV
jgi:hypothetical protein